MSLSVTVSLDNVTICANEVKAGLLDMVISRLSMRHFMGPSIEEKTQVHLVTGEIRANPAAELIKRVGVSRWPYRSFVSFYDGTMLQVKAKQAKDIKDFRLEFNPNKCDKEMVYELLRCGEDGHLTRLDVAVDYVGYDLAAYQWMDQARRKRRIYQSAAGRLETRYMGDRSSDGEMVRIYNKAKEQKMMDLLWWRVEAQTRYGLEDQVPTSLASKYFADTFANVVAADYTGGDIKLQERAMLEYLANHPEAWGELSEGSRKKYKELGSVAVPRLSPSPREVVESNLPRLTGELQNWLWACSGHRWIAKKD